MWRSVQRFFKHLVSHPWQVKRHFSVKDLQLIEKAITASEQKHTGELRFVVESGLHPYEILAKKTPKKRAIELFGRFNIWDTEYNNGVLIYLLLADRDVEIVADRGIHRQVGTQAWQAICHEMEQMFKRREMLAGVLHGITQVSLLLEKHFPAPIDSAQNPDGSQHNALPDKPIIL